MMSGALYMTQYKYIIAKISDHIFHVGRLRIDKDIYEVICTCTSIKAAELVMEALARREEELLWR
jgi:hypothetical protein